MDAFFEIVGRTGVSPLGVAVIAAIAAVVGTGASLIVSRRTVYINSVTVERSKWIEKLRNNIADILAIAYSIYQSNEDLSENEANSQAMKAKIDALYVDLHRLVSVVSLQLNPESKVDRTIMLIASFLRTTVAKTDQDALVAAHILLMRHSQWLLKFEWETVKYEASGPFRRIVLAWKRRRRLKQYDEYLGGKGSIGALQDKMKVKKAEDASA